ncbi:unnamed protein product, partial [Scytosiphon promiscuus]
LISITPLSPQPRRPDKNRGGRGQGTPASSSAAKTVGRGSRGFSRVQRQRSTPLTVAEDACKIQVRFLSEGLEYNRSDHGACKAGRNHARRSPRTNG